MVNSRANEIALILERVPLFSGFDRAQLLLLAAKIERKVFSDGELLFNEDEPCGGLHLITHGRVRIFKSSASGREQVLAVNTAGETVAELPVFDGGPFPASAIALGDVEIAYLSRRELNALCMAHPELALKLLAVVGDRLRRLVGIIEELSFTTVRQRLIAYLLKMSNTEGSPVGDGLEFHLPGTHQELANELGTVRELVSRNLMRLQAEGLIEVDARRILVVNSKELERAHEAE